jgi:hypothetical protein
MKTMPLPRPEGSHEQTRKIIEQSRQRYAMNRNELELLLDAWQKKSFSPAEKVMLRGKLEWQGIAKDIIDKFFASGEDSREIWSKENMSISTQYDIQKTEISTNDRQENTIDKISTIANLTTVQTGKDIENKESTVQILANTEWFSLANIVLWSSYEGYVKLQFNYGLFVTVKGVEWLLHKNEIIAPEGVNRKKYFNIGDPIHVIAKEIKEVDGSPRIVWSMKR